MSDQVSGRVYCLGVAEATLEKWEAENAPYKLPDDYKAFLQISDGLSLNWKIQKNDSLHSLGCIHLNRLRDIKDFGIREYRLSSVGAEDSDDTDDEETKGDGETKVKPELLGEKYSGETVVAFDMDQRVKDGRLALLYRDPNKPP